MRRRFQGLSLEEQRRISSTQKHKKKKSEHITTRRSSSATDSSKSSIKLTPYSRKAKIRSGNPFGLQVYHVCIYSIDRLLCLSLSLSSPSLSPSLPPSLSLFPSQDWQLKMNGIEASPSSDETDFVDGDTYQRNPIGALNPLMLDGKSIS